MNEKIPKTGDIWVDKRNGFEHRVVGVDNRRRRFFTIADRVAEWEEARDGHMLTPAATVVNNWPSSNLEFKSRDTA